MFGMVENNNYASVFEMDTCTRYNVCEITSAYFGPNYDDGATANSDCTAAMQRHLVHQLNEAALGYFKIDGGWAPKV